VSPPLSVTPDRYARPLRRGHRAQATGTAGEARCPYNEVIALLEFWEQGNVPPPEVAPADADMGVDEATGLPRRYVPSRDLARAVHPTSGRICGFQAEVEDVRNYNGVLPDKREIGLHDYVKDHLHPLVARNLAAVRARLAGKRDFAFKNAGHTPNIGSQGAAVPEVLLARMLVTTLRTNADLRDVPKVGEMPIGAEDMAHLSGDSIAASTQDRLIDAGPPELDAGPPEPDAASPTAGLSEALSEDESSADDQEGVPTSFLGHKVPDEIVREMQLGLEEHRARRLLRRAARDGAGGAP